MRDRSERARHRTPVLDKIIVDRDDNLLRGMDVKAMRIRRKKVREIQIPGWRLSAGVGGSGDRGAAEREEDTSDAAYIARHAKEGKRMGLVIVQG